MEMLQANAELDQLHVVVNQGRSKVSARQGSR
jgi:hypothetical protein